MNTSATGGNTYIPILGRGFSNEFGLTRIKCMKTAIVSQIEKMLKESDKKKIGIVTFNEKVFVIGDGVLAPQVIEGRYLYD